MPAGGRISLVDIGAIALAIALGVAAWVFNPGVDARGARDRPTTTADETETDESTTTSAPADPSATTAPADPTATTAPAAAPAPGAATPDPAASVPDGETPATTSPPAGPGSTTPTTTDLS